MSLLPVQDEKITCEVSEFLDSREGMPSTSHKQSAITVLRPPGRPPLIALPTRNAALPASVGEINDQILD